MDTILESRQAIPIIAIFFVFVVGIVATIGGLSIAFVKALKGPGRGQDKELDAADTQAFQELERGFRRMEERVESLETLIIDRSRNDSFEHELNK